MSHIHFGTPKFFITTGTPKVFYYEQQIKRDLNLLRNTYVCVGKVGRIQFITTDKAKARRGGGEVL